MGPAFVSGLIWVLREMNHIWSEQSKSNVNGKTYSYTLYAIFVDKPEIFIIFM